jgi:hypothetical protein
MGEHFSMPKACSGLTMEDGTRYTAPMGGTVTIERDDHIAAVKRSANYTQEHFGRGGLRLTFDQTPGPVCECGFALFPWQSVCPKCGSGPKCDCELCNDPREFGEPDAHGFSLDNGPEGLCGGRGI